MFFLLLPVEFRVYVRNGALCVVAGTTSIERLYALRYAESVPIDAAECTQSMLGSIPNLCSKDWNCVRSFVSHSFLRTLDFFRRHSLWRSLLPMCIPTWVLFAPVESRPWNRPMFSRAGCVEALFLLCAGISPRRSTSTESCRV